jgi:uncharacterized repeat protein (TIGR01451 family)
MAVVISRDDRDSGRVAVPGEVRYKLNVRNNGPETATRVELTGRFDSSATYTIEPTPGVPPCTVAPNTRAFTCEIGTMVPGQTAELDVKVNVSSLPQAGRSATIVLDAKVSSGEPDLDPANNSDTESVELGP